MCGKEGVLEIICGYKEKAAITAPFMERAAADNRRTC